MSHAKHASLLIADDDPVVRSLLGSQLSPYFDVLIAAADTREAIELAREHQPTAALIDVNMPDGGGLEAVRQIAIHSPTTSMIVLSADEEHSLVTELIRAGATTYLRKGVSTARLAQAIDDSINAHGQITTAPTHL